MSIFFREAWLVNEMPTRRTRDYSSFFPDWQQPLFCLCALVRSLTLEIPFLSPPSAIIPIGNLTSIQGGQFFSTKPCTSFPPRTLTKPRNGIVISSPYSLIITFCMAASVHCIHFHSLPTNLHSFICAFFE